MPAIDYGRWSNIAAHWSTEETNVASKQPIKKKRPKRRKGDGDMLYHGVNNCILLHF